MTDRGGERLSFALWWDGLWDRLDSSRSTKSTWRSAVVLLTAGVLFAFGSRWFGPYFLVPLAAVLGYDLGGFRSRRSGRLGRVIVSAVFAAVTAAIVYLFA